MSQRIAAKPVRLTIPAALTAAALLAVFGTAPVSGQSNAAPKPVARAAEIEQQQRNLIYSPWTKFCLKEQERNAKQVCFTAKDARFESGAPVVAVVLIEPDKNSKKVLRVTLPLGMQIVPGTRVVIDQGRPMPGPYVICFASGCTADHEVTTDVLNRLKKGRQLAVQAINSNGQAVSLNLPLEGFATAYDGPPTDVSSFEERQKKLRQELQASLEDIRQMVERERRARGQRRPR